MKARLVHYFGNVQGVGFRATASMIARNHPVTGWVRNLDDGRVEMLIEGSEQAITEFMKEIRDRWGEDIAEEQIEEREATGNFTRFGIAR